jgi:hypothetical protein
MTSLQATAQGCPPGQHPVAGQGWNYCAPVPGGTEEQAPPPQPSGFKWKSHWHSTAIDNGAGALGTSTGQVTAEDAQHGALLDCRSKGGSNCEIQITYVNGCVAMAVGKKNRSGAPTKDEAIKKAISVCGKGDSTCQLYYSSCDLPDRVPTRSAE